MQVRGRFGGRSISASTGGPTGCAHHRGGVFHTMHRVIHRCLWMTGLARVSGGHIVTMPVRPSVRDLWVVGPTVAGTDVREGASGMSIPLLGDARRRGRYDEHDRVVGPRLPGATGFATPFGEPEVTTGNQETWSGRMPPQDPDAEQSVLGSMLISKDAIADVNEALGGTDFYRPAHETIYDAIVDLYSAASRPTRSRSRPSSTAAASCSAWAARPTSTRSRPASRSRPTPPSTPRSCARSRSCAGSSTPAQDRPVGYAGEGDVDDTVDPPSKRSTRSGRSGPPRTTPP